MSERKPAGLSFESWVERQIREATEAGEFDDLPGRGKPIPGLNRPYDELWWVRQKMAREGLSTEEILPTPLKLRKEIHRLPETVRPLRTEQEVRAAVADLNRRIMAHLRMPSGPRIPVRVVDPEPVVEQWQAARKPAGTVEHAPPATPEKSPRGRLRFFRRRRK